MAHEMPTRARLHELFDDGGDTLIYRVANTRMPAGARVVSKTSSGYLRVYVDNKRYLVHRLLWVYRGGSLTTQCKGRSSRRQPTEQPGRQPTSRNSCPEHAEHQAAVKQHERYPWCIVAQSLAAVAGTGEP